MHESLMRVLLSEQEARVRRWSQEARDVKALRWPEPSVCGARPLVRIGRLALVWRGRAGAPR